MLRLILTLSKSGFCKDSPIPMECDGILYRIVMPWENFDVIMIILYGLMISSAIMIAVKIISDLSGHRISERRFLNIILVVSILYSSFLWTGTMYCYLGIPTSILINLLVAKTMNKFENNYSQIDHLSMKELTELGFFGWKLWEHHKLKSEFLSLNENDRQTRLHQFIGVEKILSRKYQLLLIFLTPFICVAVYVVLNIGYILML
jgi:hypothetical protein